MKALSIRQPWAWLIAAGIKDVENRTWWTPVRGRIYIQAGKKFDEEGYNRLISATGGIGYPLKVDYKLGAIIGEVDIIDCKFRHADDMPFLYSKWHDPGYWGFILANPLMYDYPIPCRGQLGFFEVQMPEVETEYSETFRDK